MSEDEPVTGNTIFSRGNDGAEVPSEETQTETMSELFQ